MILAVNRKKRTFHDCVWFGSVLWDINHCRLFNAKSIFIHKQLYFEQFGFAWAHSLNIKTVLFQTIQFNISTQLSSIWPIHRTLSSATTPGQSGPGSDGNEGVFNIPQIFSITGISPSECLVSYPGHSLGEFFPPSAEMQLVYFTAPVNWARLFLQCMETCTIFKKMHSV